MKKYILPIIGQHTDTVILANGDFPSHPIALSILENCKYLVCCDGAINNLSATDKIPNAIVGDCDSLSKENKERFTDIIHRIAEQETNDLTKAVNFCVQQGRKKITILGATGKREDHTIGNISLLCEYMRSADVEMITDYGIFNAITSDSIFESIPQQQVSIFCIDQYKITSHNLAYAIKDQVFTNWWQATLNEAESNEFVIKTYGRTIIYRAF
ncbi:thiamine pyrophosphokinase [Dysgonomonas hofstadii]|uniref:Thiamine diphosphokinase n=1 Tax=Dysgonomonas hofstadii TaxID=637886 RepID=A0A840CGE2_9BACT|nr:thiamine diphosphokinase [Dysgonomonas hofstadii]MBB4035030.1 thiamine pyrophosphokinase [Dysgonomonas hofstadii]